MWEVFCVCSVGSVLDLWEVFWILGCVLDSGKCFWIVGSVSDCGKSFDFWEVFLDSEKCF